MESFLSLSWSILLLLVLISGCSSGGSPEDPEDTTKDIAVREDLAEDSETGCRALCDGLSCDDGCGGACALCDDGDPCTTADQCVDGVCVGDPSWTPECVYESAPDMQECVPGTVSEQHRQLALDEMNRVRSLHSLPPLVYDLQLQDGTQACALIIGASLTLSHHPPESWPCWTQEGADACALNSTFIQPYSELHDPEPPSSAIRLWLVDPGVETLGHRRFLLSPFLAVTAYGAVHGEAKVVPAGKPPYVFAATMDVSHEPMADIAGIDIDYVAYPYGDYPASLFDNDWYLSFSALADDQDYLGNAYVSYGDASIKVRGPDGQAMGLSSISWNNDYKGLPNHLQWKVTGLTTETLYSVTIEGVDLGDEVRDYEYTFRLVPDDQPER